MTKKLLLPGENEIPPGIAVHTRRGNPIDNDNSGELTPLMLSEVSEWLVRFPDTAVGRRTGPIACFNCHGLTFASRRTRIANSNEIRRIIQEDGYAPVSRSDLRPGDIVLYVKADGDIEHSGVVLWVNNSAVPFGSLPGDALSPIVLSKWGPGEEVIHRERMCPYEGRNEYYRVTHGLDE